MALELRQSLILTQQLVMTPQMQLAIKLLHLTRLELIETINEEIEENPALEESFEGEPDEEGSTDADSEQIGQYLSDMTEVTAKENAPDGFDWENDLSEYNIERERSFAPYEERDNSPAVENILPAQTNLYSHLMWQLGMNDLDEDQKEIGVHIIHNLNEDGFLEISPEEISHITGHALEKVLETLCMIQEFDPVGVATRDTRESLLIQIRFQDLGGSVAEKIIMDHLGDLENRKYNHIARQLSVPIDEILTALTVIQGLEPKPGRIYSSERTIYITPDIYVIKTNDKYEIVQNENGLPKLKISPYYKDILRNGNLASKDVKTYIQEKLKSAAWLIKSIHQRQRTIYRVTESIVRFQKDFLDNGITRLRPLVLRDVADDIEMHESTVSRVTKNKYVHTPQGLFELKYFLGHRTFVWVTPICCGHALMTWNAAGFLLG
ncbi:RNA polymerase sigma-54 factor [uncultured Desulfobacterium sp.]|uniref:RNA polymerase sigma-54 factor n=1 Tax=uncultured Desulfobacterium sp. TaxID=201089 RepID=A0A445MYC3_9BACT|nr:RNA polymerase sigma-54 factor [uncultured Desulfobacterium sp.]